MHARRFSLAVARIIRVCQYISYVVGSNTLAAPDIYANRVLSRLICQYNNNYIYFLVVFAGSFILNLIKFTDI